jgi:hypothetical protein
MLELRIEMRWYRMGGMLELRIEMRWVGKEECCGAEDWNEVGRKGRHA